MISTDSIDNKTESSTIFNNRIDKDLPPPVDCGVIPAMEWWDELFLPKQMRETRKSSKSYAENDHFDSLNIINNKTYKYIQHPVPVKPLG